MSLQWYAIENANEIDSPALVLFEDRIIQNIRAIKKQFPDLSLLRPHVKTNKISEVCALMMKEGITKFKCATIAEAEMLGILNVEDVLLAYQPNGPKMQRFVSLIKTFPDTKFSCLVDNPSTAEQLSVIATENNISLPVFIDLNVGMNRTGLPVEHAWSLFEMICSMKNLSLAGLHAYDGHLTDADRNTRKEKEVIAFAPVFELSKKIEIATGSAIALVAGGSTTYAIHASENIECSPGTFVFWDWTYKNLLPEAPFEPAAVLLVRILSIINDKMMCVDLGHKSVAAENPLPRVYFLNLENWKAVSQSEEHLVIECDTTKLNVGNVLYGIPIHICPTVALYEKAFVVNDHIITKQWKVIARDRMITI
jgi:D-serine deaminase-like pyridoxal phosphate-dependent protein